MSRKKPLLVGLHNPMPEHKDDALYPAPSGTPGASILAMIQMIDPDFTAENYLDAFDRCYLWKPRLLPHGRGAQAAFAAAGDDVRHESAHRKDVVLFGNRVWWSIIDRKEPEYFASKSPYGPRKFWRMPHPSGRCPTFHAERNRRKAGELLLRLAGG